MRTLGCFLSKSPPPSASSKGSSYGPMASIRGTEADNQRPEDGQHQNSETRRVAESGGKSWKSSSMLAWCNLRNSTELRKINKNQQDI